MDSSMNLVTAQVTFLDAHLVLVHVPTELYPLFTNPILRLLFGDDHEEIGIEDDEKLPWTERHPFLNISIKKVGTSIITTRYLCDKYIAPYTQLINGILPSAQTTQESACKPEMVEISHEEYTAILLTGGPTLDPAQRVLELTTPLAMAGISIFFITTYFCDYVLVPVHSRQTVITALQQRGFVFSAQADAYVNQLSPTLTQSGFIDRPRTASSSGSDSGVGLHPGGRRSVPTTPPAKDVPELQIRTFRKLKQNNIVPEVDDSLRLVSCALQSAASEEERAMLKNDLIQIILASNSPKSASSIMKDAHETKRSARLLSEIFSKSLALSNASASNDQNPTPPGSPYATTFLSLTLTAEDPPSLLLEERFLTLLESGKSHLLLNGTVEDDPLIPITLDLRNLNWNATGVVGGVAGRLSLGPIDVDGGVEKRLSIAESDRDEAADEDGSEVEREPLEISFSSSAKAESVIVKQSHLSLAVKALRMGMAEVERKIGGDA